MSIGPSHYWQYWSVLFRARLSRDNWQSLPYSNGRLQLLALLLLTSSRALGFMSLCLSCLSFCLLSEVHSPFCLFDRSSRCFRPGARPARRSHHKECVHAMLSPARSALLTPFFDVKQAGRENGENELGGVCVCGFGVVIWREYYGTWDLSLSLRISEF